MYNFQKMCLMAVPDLEHMLILKIHKKPRNILACINEDKYRNDVILKEQNKDRHLSFLYDFIKSALF